MTFANLLRSVTSGIAVLVLVGFLATPSWGISLDTGAPIIAIDGDGDGDVAVYIQSTAFSVTDPYLYGYFLNGGSTFNILGVYGVNYFVGGNVIDFAIYDGTKYYTLSGDAGDDSYSVLMNFGNPVTIGSPQQPASWSDPYYYNSNITWTILPSVPAANTNELAVDFFGGGNDGVAPLARATAVPEPGTLLLLGSGLLGVGIFARKGSRQA